MAKKKVETYVMYYSFIQSAKMYGAKIFREAVLKYQEYALKGKVKPSESNEVNFLINTAKQQIDNAKERYARCKANGELGKDSGSKGGRTPKTPKEPQEEPQ